MRQCPFRSWPAILASLAVISGGCRSAEKESYEVFEKFAKAAAVGGFAEARALATPEAEAGITAAEQRLADDRFRERIREFHSVRCALVSATKAAGTVQIVAVEVVKLDPPGTFSTTGIVAIPHRLTATLVKADGTWKVSAFDDVPGEAGSAIPGIP